jgi:tetratricopeptide (TPR) repeat protein
MLTLSFFKANLHQNDPDIGTCMNDLAFTLFRLNRLD